MGNDCRKFQNRRGRCQNKKGRCENKKKVAKIREKNAKQKEEVAKVKKENAHLMNNSIFRQREVAYRKKNIACVSQSLVLSPHLYYFALILSRLINVLSEVKKNAVLSSVKNIPYKARQERI
jgi:hypothetical protein